MFVETLQQIMQQHPDWRFEFTNGDCGSNYMHIRIIAGPPNAQRHCIEKSISHDDTLAFRAGPDAGLTDHLRRLVSTLEYALE